MRNNDYNNNNYDTEDRIGNDNYNNHKPKEEKERKRWRRRKVVRKKTKKDESTQEDRSEEEDEEAKEKGEGSHQVLGRRRGGFLAHDGFPPDGALTPRVGTGNQRSSFVHRGDEKKEKRVRWKEDLVEICEDKGEELKKLDFQKEFDILGRMHKKWETFELKEAGQTYMEGEKECKLHEAAETALSLMDDERGGKEQMTIYTDGSYKDGEGA